MKNRITALALAGLLLLSGCTSMLERSDVSAVTHVDYSVTEDSSILRVETYQALVSSLLHFVNERADTGTIRLYKGDNEIAIPVTATSGEIRTYKITITTTGGVDRPNAPVITGKEHTVGDIITKVEPETGVDKFIENLAVSNGTAKVFTADGQAKTSGHIATGDILRLYSDETLCASYPVVIYGDVNGDGRITSLDLRITQKHILGVDKLEGYILTAADTGKDGNVTSLDLRLTQKHILGITKTLQ